MNPLTEHYNEWMLITGRDVSTSNGKKGIDPITGKMPQFYGEARIEVPAEHPILVDLHLKVNEIIGKLGLTTVYRMNPFYTTQKGVRKAYLAVGYREEPGVLNDLETLKTYL